MINIGLIPTCLSSNTELAQVFEDALSVLWDGESSATILKTEWSCDAVGRFSDSVAALVQLQCLTREDYTAYSQPDPICPTPQKRQLHRALWLTLLAEMAEQGDLTSEGLKPSTEEDYVTEEDVKVAVKAADFCKGVKSPVNYLDEEQCRARLNDILNAYYGRGATMNPSVDVLSACRSALLEAAMSTHVSMRPPKFKATLEPRAQALPEGTQLLAGLRSIYWK